MGLELDYLGLEKNILIGFEENLISAAHPALWGSGDSQEDGRMKMFEFGAALSWHTLQICSSALGRGGGEMERPQRTEPGCDGTGQEQWGLGGDGSKLFLVVKNESGTAAAVIAGTATPKCGTNHSFCRTEKY